MLFLVLMMVAVVAVGAWLVLRAGDDDGGGDEAVQRGPAVPRRSPVAEELLAQGLLHEAAEYQAAHGHADDAVALYEEAGDVAAAARVHLRKGQWQMAALTYKRGGELVAAAGLYAQHGLNESAADLYDEAGDLGRAAAHWESAGELGRAAKVRARMGDHEAVARLSATAAERTGDFSAAAQAWAALGDRDRAMDAWQKAGRPEEAGRMLVAAGDSLGGARLLVEGGAFEEAAKLLARAGKFKEAAHAAYRGGDVPLCITYLEVAGDHFGMAEVYLQYGMRDDAKACLRQAREGMAEFEACWELLATVELEDGSGQRAAEAYERMVAHAVETDRVDARVGRWLHALAQIELERGRVDAAVEHMRRTEALGLSSSNVSGRLRELRDQGEPTVTAMPECGWADLVKQASSVVYPRHDRYVIEDKIGQGGYGVVYLARDLKLGRSVVVKMIANRAVGTDTARRWFLREARNAAKLNHANIITVYDVGDIDGQPFIAMEYVDGTTLKDHLEGRLPLAFEETLPLLEQILDAIAHAHDQGIVHRDIKLANMMIDRRGRVKLMDFGLALALRNPEHSMVIAGTPAYMSPEAIHGMDIDHQSDVYAVGVLMFKLLTGRFPYESDNVLEAHRLAEIPEPRDFNPEIPVAVAACVRQAMAKAKFERFSTIRALAAALGVPLAAKAPVPSA